jgi:hypothetical protein
MSQRGPRKSSSAASKRTIRASKPSEPVAEEIQDAGSDIDIFDEESIVSALDALQKGKPARSLAPIPLYAVKKTASPRKAAPLAAVATEPSGPIRLESGSSSAQGTFSVYVTETL